MLELFVLLIILLPMCALALAGHLLYAWLREQPAAPDCAIRLCEFSKPREKRP